MKTGNKVVLTLTDPDQETLNWIAGKFRAAYLNELDRALTKAERAIQEKKPRKIRTRPLTIEITPA